MCMLRFFFLETIHVLEKLCNKRVLPVCISTSCALPGDLEQHTSTVPPSPPFPWLSCWKFFFFYFFFKNNTNLREVRSECFPFLCYISSKNNVFWHTCNINIFLFVERWEKKRKKSEISKIWIFDLRHFQIFDPSIEIIHLLMYFW